MNRDNLPIFFFTTGLKRVCCCCSGCFRTLSLLRPASLPGGNWPPLRRPSLLMEFTDVLFVLVFIIAFFRVCILQRNEVWNILPHHFQQSYLVSSYDTRCSFNIFLGKNGFKYKTEENLKHRKLNNKTQVKLDYTYFPYEFVMICIPHWLWQWPTCVHYCTTTHKTIRNYFFVNC